MTVKDIKDFLSHYNDDEEVFFHIFIEDRTDEKSTQSCFSLEFIDNEISQNIFPDKPFFNFDFASYCEKYLYQIFCENA